MMIVVSSTTILTSDSNNSATVEIILSTDDSQNEYTFDDFFIYNEESSTPSGYTAADVNLVPTLQSKTILNYAIGDFDGDDNEGIAVLHQSYIMYFGLNLTTGALELLYYTDIYT